MRLNMYDLNKAEWSFFMNHEGYPEWRAKQVLDWLYKSRVTTFLEMKNLPNDLIITLKKRFEAMPLVVEKKQIAQDGTVKFLCKLGDGALIETVLLKHNYGFSVCVTSQVGCRIGCTFCASTMHGLQRNLSAGEMVAQVIIADKYLHQTSSQRVRSIVLMGSGEPFENYDESIKFVRMACAEEGLNIGQRRITVSTSGVVPGIYRFADEGWQVGLAISLHAPNDQLRSRLMPINRRYPLLDLLTACRYYCSKTKRRITFEYTLIQGENDKNEHAFQLADLIQGMNTYVNLIPLNSVAEKKYVCSSPDRFEKFLEILTSRRIRCTVRHRRGYEIDAACGQLRNKARM